MSNLINSFGDYENQKQNFVLDNNLNKIKSNKIKWKDIKSSRFNFFINKKWLCKYLCVIIINKNEKYKLHNGFFSDSRNKW